MFVVVSWTIIPYFYSWVDLPTFVPIQKKEEEGKPFIPLYQTKQRNMKLKWMKKNGIIWIYMEIK